MGRKRVEASVMEGQRRTRAMLDTALDGIVGMDHQGLITEFNPAAERMFGYRREGVLGRELAELLIPLNPWRSPSPECRTMAHPGSQGLCVI
jgi:PAS domain-containing protein